MKPSRAISVALADFLEPRRLLANPIELDLTFGSGGVVSEILGGVRDSVNIHFIASVAGGKILLGGQVESQGAQIARLNGHGSLDTSFNTDGISPFIPFDAVNRGAIQSDGKIVLAGISGGKLAVVRFNADGSPDSTFGVSGVATAPLPSGATEGEALAIALQTDGKIVIGGYVSRPASGNTSDPTFIELARFNSDGSLDTTFDHDGVVVLDLLDSAHTETNSYFGDLAINGGKVLIGGNTDRPFLARFNSDGSPDSTFATPTTPGIIFPGDPVLERFASIHKLLVLSDGKFLVGGDAPTDSRIGTGVVERFNADGTGDTTFPDTRGSVDTSVRDLAIDPDGNIVVLTAEVPFPDAFPTVRRLFSNGEPDSNFGQARPAVDFGYPSALAVQDDGRIIVAEPGDGVSDVIARLALRPDQYLAGNGTLQITGTFGNNTISIVASGTHFVLSRNGITKRYSSTSLKRVDIKTFSGNDTITIPVDLPERSQIDTGDFNDTVTLGNMSAGINATGDLVVRAGDGQVNVYTSSGTVDVILGNGGDQVFSAYGDDTIVTGGGDDLIGGGNGNDSISAGGGNDDIMGDPGDDTINAGAGDDSVEGNAGNDYINADAGDDTVWGGTNLEHGNQSDDDTFVDILIGGDGDDRMYGGGGSDSLYGNAGRDVLFGGPGSDLLSGGGGRDRMAGEDGKDRLYGGAGNDRLDGGASADRIFGQGGDDVLYSGEGKDILNGGPGADRLFGAPWDQHDDDPLDTLIGFE